MEKYLQLLPSNFHKKEVDSINPIFNSINVISTYKYTTPIPRSDWLSIHNKSPYHAKPTIQIFNLFSSLICISLSRSAHPNHPVILWQIILSSPSSSVPYTPSSPDPYPTHTSHNIVHYAWIVSKDRFSQVGRGSFGRVS